MVLEKRGNPRKSRRARLSSASYTGRTWFAPSPEERRRIEAALGVRFSEEQFRELVGIVDNYFGMQPFERAAPFADDAQAWLNEVRSKARTFFEVLTRRPGSRRDAAFVVERLITKNLEDGRLGGQEKWNEILLCMSSFVVASEFAAKELSQQIKRRGFVEGDAWSKLIRELTLFCQARSLPTHASKGLNKSPRAKPSPFVAFVYELQLAFPGRFRRHNFSYGALATAITNARAPARELKSGTARIKLPPKP
jgi:hypothetical protein